MIKRIEIDKLREMDGREGLILQGFGSYWESWAEKIEEDLREENILPGGELFQMVYVFDYQNSTCLLFDFEDVGLDNGKLAMWRLRTHEVFGGTWLSDFRQNQLGMAQDESPSEQVKPDCALIGRDGNIFHLLGVAARTLRENNLQEQATEMTNRVMQSAESYDHALAIIAEYVHITAANEEMKLENF